MTEHGNLQVPTSSRSARSWLGLGVLCLPTAVLALDMSVLYLALPHIAAAVGADATRELWILDIYPLLIAGFLVSMGGLGDRIGQRRLLLTGAGAFTVISAIAAFSVTAEMLIAARAALGVAGATLMPATLALINVMFPDPQHRRTAIAVWTSAFMTGFAVGPVVGGLLLEIFWWGAAFLLAVPVMALLLVTGRALLPEHRRPDPGRFDLLSAGLFVTAILPLVYATKALSAAGASWTTLAALGLGVLAATAFVVRQNRLTDPLFDLRLLTDRSVATALLLLVLGPAIVGGMTLFVPQYLQITQGLDALEAGALVAPAALGLIVGALLAPVAARRWAVGTVIAVGLLAACAGLVMIASGVTVGPVWVVAGLVVLYLGSGPFDALGTDLVIGAAPSDKAGSAGAATETATELGTGVGIAVLGTVGTTVYQSRIAEALPSGLPAAAEARESISGAATALTGLDGAQRDVMAQAASAAFASGVQAVSLVAAGTALILAVATALLFRSTA